MNGTVTRHAANMTALCLGPVLQQRLRDALDSAAKGDTHVANFSGVFVVPIRTQKVCVAYLRLLDTKTIWQRRGIGVAALVPPCHG